MEILQHAKDWVGGKSIFTMAGEKLDRVNFDRERARLERLLDNPETIEKLSTERVSRGYTLPDFPIDDLIYRSKGVILCGDQGAGKSSAAQYICQHFPEHAVVVLDPHMNITPESWPNVTIVSDEFKIFESMLWFLTLMDQDVNDRSKVIIVADEFMEIRGHELNKKDAFKGLADRFIRLMSTKPRKFNKMGLFLTHSPNVEAIGIDSNLRENYHMIVLGAVAKKKSIQDVAYPCLFNDEQVKHPTHWPHETFAKLGKKPFYLSPANHPQLTTSLPLTFRGPDPEKFPNYCQWIELKNEWKLTATSEKVETENTYPLGSESSENPSNGNIDYQKEVKSQKNSLVEPERTNSSQHQLIRKTLKEMGYGENPEVKERGLKTKVMKKLGGIKRGDNTVYKRFSKTFDEVLIEYGKNITMVGENNGTINIGG